MPIGRLITDVDIDSRMFTQGYPIGKGSQIEIDIRLVISIGLRCDDNDVRW